MNNTPSPRDLDPKFSKATIPGNDKKETATVTKESTDPRDAAHANVAEETADVTDEPTVVSPRTVNGVVDTEIPAHLENEVSQIVFIQRFTGPDGRPTEKVHGPMAQADWPAYEKENDL